MNPVIGPARCATWAAGRFGFWFYITLAVKGTKYRKFILISGRPCGLPRGLKDARLPKTPSPSGKRRGTGHTGQLGYGFLTSAAHPGRKIDTNTRDFEFVYPINVNSGSVGSLLTP